MKGSLTCHKCWAKNKKTKKKGQEHPGAGGIYGSTSCTRNGSDNYQPQAPSAPQGAGKTVERKAKPDAEKEALEMKKLKCTR